METLNTPRLTLRPWHSSDQEPLIRYANNRKVWMGLREIFPHPYTDADAKAWLRQAKQNPKHFNYAIEYSGECIGGISLHLMEDVYAKTAELGYWLGEPFWGQGFATEAITHLVKWAWNQLPIERIQAGVFSSNPASRRVLEKLGFAEEAIHKKAVFKSGQLLDEYLYVKFREEEP